MPPSQREVLQFLEKKQSHQPSPAIDAGLLKSAAVSAEKLTGTPEWDRYLSYMQAEREEFQKQYIGWREKLEYAKSQEDVKECQINCAIYKSCVQVLEKFMELPATLMKEHHAQS